jgi:hypothetical protein
MDSYYSADTEKADIEFLLAMYHKNAEKIALEQSKKAPRGFFGGLSEYSSQEESQGMLELMATNYLIVRKLHGQEVNEPLFSDSEDIKTLGDFVKSKLLVGLMGIKGTTQENQ